MRIVGGQWRSRLIDVPAATGLRPTPDRVRETLFNWLGQDLTGKRCVDLFAGSGALGFEAASRHAAEVVMVEKEAKVYAHLKAAAAALSASNVRLVRGDALNFLQSSTQRFDVIFADPPYRQGWLEKLSPLLAAALQPNGVVYAEAEAPVHMLGPLQAIKSGRAGQVHYQLFSLQGDE